MCTARWKQQQQSQQQQQWQAQRTGSNSIGYLYGRIRTAQYVWQLPAQQCISVCIGSSGLHDCQMPDSTLSLHWGKTAYRLLFRRDFFVGPADGRAAIVMINIVR
jgi:hypothetical protein